MPEDRLPSRSRRMIGRLWTVGLTLIVIAAAGLAVLQGRAFLADRASAATTPDAAPPLPVATQALRIEDGYTIERRFTGQIEPAQQTGLSFETGGTLASIRADEGDAVAAGDIVATLDTRLLEAERDRLAASRRALEARAELARRTEERQSALEERGFSSTQTRDEAALGLAETEARIAEIDAALVSIEVQLDKSRLVAPFDATIARRHVDAGSMVPGGQPVLTLVETAQPQFRAGLAPTLAARVAGQRAATVRIDGRDYPVTFAAVLPDLDPATRTRTLLFDFTESDVPVFGQTGELIVEDAVATPGAWVPIAALQEGPRGLWQVLTVTSDDQPRVGIEAVEVLVAREDAAFVRGTFTGDDRLILDGAHRVVPGQAVTADAGTE